MSERDDDEPWHHDTMLNLRSVQIAPVQIPIVPLL